MSGTPKAKISLRDIRVLQAGQTIWDRSVSGLAARRQVSPVVSYILMYRTMDGRKRTYTIGKHGSPWTPETARQEARRILREVVKGADPMADKLAEREAITVAELCQQYMVDVEAGRLLTRRKAAKTESTLISDRGRIARHIIPLLGRRSVASVTRDDVEAFMHDIATGKTASRQKTNPRGLSVVRGGRGVASRSVGLLGAIFTYAVRKGLRFDNPAHGIVRFADGRRQRRLAIDEYRMLGMALSMADQENVWKPAIAAAWLMILTGWRRGEVLGLRWSEVDLPRRTARLADTKTGASLRPLSELACMVIQSQPMVGDVVFASRSGGQMIGHRKKWLRIAKLSGLPADIAPHVLRHSFASLAADLGYNEPTIASLLGHKTHSITSRYMHSADVVLLAAADVVANATMKLMAEKTDLTSDQAQPQLRNQQRDGSVVWDGITSL
jgi:integrase